MKTKNAIWLRLVAGIMLVLAFTAHDSLAQDFLSTPSPLDQVRSAPPLKVLSWNIYMLPPLAKFTGKQRRAKHIGNLLKDSDFDIFVFQEAFHGAARRKIWRRLKQNFPHRSGPANKRWYSLRTNSGIWMVSRIPLRQLGAVDFKECDGIDCWSRKGALLAQGEFAGQTFQILGTHLEAGGSPELKEGQYREIDTLLTQHRQTLVPQLICGDFNTHRNDSARYNLMIDILGVQNAMFDGDQQFTSDGELNDIKLARSEKKKRAWIDYAFYRPNGINADVKRFVRMPRSRWSKKFQDLSDHFAVEAQFRFDL